MNVLHTATPRPGVLLGIATVVLAWLLPNHSPPWPAFYNEMWMAIALLPVAGWLLLRSSTPLRWPAAALFVATLTSVPLLQWGSGLVRYGGDAALAAMYLLGLALCVVLGARWRDLSAHEASRCVFTTLLVSALLSTHLALLQWLRIDGLGVLLADLPIGWRPIANIGQANHLASLIFLGLVSTWGLYLSAALRGGVAGLAASYLLFGIAMTQSRTAWLEIALLAAAALIWRRQLFPQRCRVGIYTLLGLFIGLVWLWPTINHALLLDGGLSLSGQMQTGRRPALWHAMAEAVLAAPWAGYGWTQVVLAQQALATASTASHAPLQLVFSYAHNLVLDLLVWNGVVLGSLICAALGLWFWRQARRVRNADETLLFLALCGLLIHAMFEFPHAYAYFVLPAGVMAGLLPSPGWCLHMPRRIAIAMLMLVAMAIAALSFEYTRAEEALRQARFQVARIRLADNEQVPRLRWLDQLQGLVDQMRAEPRATMSPAEQVDFRRAVERFPTSAGQYRLAVMWAHYGAPTEAAQALKMLCATQPPQVCATALTAWRIELQSDASMALVVLPETGHAAAQH